MHIEEYFADLINQVDMACEVYLDPINKAMHNFTANELSERPKQARNDQVESRGDQGSPELMFHELAEG